MCYTRELLCVECQISSARYKTTTCNEGTCIERKKKVYLKYGLCNICVELPEMQNAKKASLDDLQFYAKFNRRARTTKGRADSPSRRRRDKKREGLTDKQVGFTFDVDEYGTNVGFVPAKQASKQARIQPIHGFFLLQFDRESDLTTSSKPHLWVDWADKLENLLIENDRDRRRKVTEKVTTIQLRLVAEELLKNPKRTSWGWSSLIKAPPSTPINPSGR